MKNYSLTIGGVITAVVGSIVVTFGLTDSCSNEIVEKVAPLIPVIGGGIMSYIGRLKNGNVNVLGFKK